MTFRSIIILGHLLWLSQQSAAQGWSSLAEGCDQSIRWIFADSLTDLLWVAGGFDSAGTLYSRGIAVWDQDQWNALPVGSDGQNVLTVERYQNNIYIGGAFQQMGGIDSKHIAIWQNGVGWAAPDLAPNGSVVHLEVYQDELYAMGVFDSIGNIEAKQLAKLGPNGWEAVPMPEPWVMLGAATDIEGYQGDLYFCGNLQSNQSPEMRDIMRWDGQQWHPLGNGLSGSLTWVNFMVEFQGVLVVGGWFWETEGDPGNCIAKWDGNNWGSFGSGMNGQPFAATVFNDKLYVAGSFLEIDGQPFDRIACYDGQSWTAVGSFNNSIKSLAVLDGRLYAAGGFKEVNGIPANYIAVLDTATGVFEAVAQPAIQQQINVRFGHSSTTAIISNLDAKTYTVEVFSPNGTCLRKQTIQGPRATIQLDKANAGLYLFRFYDGIKPQTVKVMRAH